MLDTGAIILQTTIKRADTVIVTVEFSLQIQVHSALYDVAGRVPSMLKIGSNNG